MTPQYLRQEAARFRAMAEETDREATKERFLAIAADYEARAGSDTTVPEPISSAASSDVAEPVPEEPRKLTLGRKIASGLQETVVVQRRPVGRPRRE